MKHICHNPSAHTWGCLWRCIPLDSRDPSCTCYRLSKFFHLGLKGTRHFDLRRKTCTAFKGERRRQMSGKLSLGKTALSLLTSQLTTTVKQVQHSRATETDSCHKGVSVHHNSWSSTAEKAYICTHDFCSANTHTSIRRCSSAAACISIRHHTHF
jgi:hypothetical protein